MRAVFTVDIPSIGHAKFPNNQEIINELRTHGWENVEVSELDESQQTAKYKELAIHLLEQMPEIRKTEEANQVIYYGELQDDKTKFVVTRVVQGQMTFRLLHPNLARLQRSTEKIISKLINSRLGDTQFNISNDLVLVYERGFEDVIIEGRVISKPFREATKTNRRDVLLVLGSILILVPTIIGLFFYSSAENRIIGGTLESLSTALITTIIVSALGFFQTYYEIMREKLIHWLPFSEK
jgi:hypothetical protein